MRLEIRDRDTIRILFDVSVVGVNYNSYLPKSCITMDTKEKSNIYVASFYDPEASLDFFTTLSEMSYHSFEYLYITEKYEEVLVEFKYINDDKPERIKYNKGEAR